MTRYFWTPLMESYLVENFEWLGAAHVASALGLRSSQVRRKARILGLQRGSVKQPRGRPFTSSDPRRGPGRPFVGKHTARRDVVA